MININDSHINPELTFKRLVYLHMQQLTNFPYIEKDFDALTDYELLCLVVKYLNDVIKNSNDQNDSITNLYNAFLALQNYMNESVQELEDAWNDKTNELETTFNQLHDYVQNYFANLDVQDEINNKLDQMLEDGVLEQIIEQFIQSTAVWCFDTVADLKDATNLINGSYAKTLGYYNITDGGTSNYKIRTKTNDDVIDEGSIISLNDNTLIAELVPSDYITIYQFGAKGDGTTDDSDFIQNAINYSKNNNYIKIKGETERTSAITKTLKFHAYNQAENLYLDVKSNSLTNNYMISVNSNNVSTWDIEYPNTTKGYLKNIYLNNSNEISGINGIFNASNNRYEQIHTNKLNISFMNIASYLDSVKIFNIQVSNKIGTDYAIRLGYLGDSCELNTAHMYGTIGTANFITGFQGHNAITLKNIICNGNLLIDGGNVSIENIHSESGQITIKDSITNISNGFFYHNNPNIIISNSYVKLNQLEFAYYTKLFDYTDSNDIDINITNSNVEINDCYKTIKSENINEKITSYVKTNLDTQPTINNNKRYYKTNLRNTNDIQCSFDNDTRSVAYPETSDKVKWRLPSGTYYYKAIPIIDFDRMLRTAYYDGGGNATLTNNGNGFRFSAADGGKWRIYRGTTDNSYDSYVDIAICGGSIQDDGTMCNGFKWQPRTAGDVDTFNTGNNGAIEYVKNNIRCFKTSLPTVGTWKKGDIIYNIDANANNIGWLCIADGTPGTWKEF